MGALHSHVTAWRRGSCGESVARDTAHRSSIRYVIGPFFDQDPWMLATSFFRGCYISCKLPRDSAFCCEPRPFRSLAFLDTSPIIVLSLCITLSTEHLDYMSASVLLRKRRSVASRPITNRPQTITGQQNKALNEEQERERQARELDARRRRARRRLDELERINYRDAPAASTTASASLLDAPQSGPNENAIALTTGDSEFATTGAASGVSQAQRRRNQAEVKRILVGGRRNLHSIVDELADQGRLPLRPGKGRANWRSARSGPSTTPGRKYCSICGYHGDLACMRCGHRYCSRQCRDV